MRQHRVAFWIILESPRHGLELGDFNYRLLVYHLSESIEALEIVLIDHCI